MGGGQGTAVPWPSSRHPLPQLFLTPGQAVLVWGESIRPLAAAAAAWGVARGARVWVVDAANLFDPYRLVREARRRGLARAVALSQVQVARAFTSHQLVRLLKEELPGGVKPLSLVLVLGPVSLFYDEQIPLSERYRLFADLTAAMAALKVRVPLLLLQPPRPSGAPNRNFGRRLAPLVDLFLTEPPSPRALPPQKRGDL
uniref:Rad51-like C-terminal domain-containing protein n=1 Tax=Desulfobacca acetoxidans TaxID=60893 RepID=A0A7C5EM97_9BACT